MNPTILLVFTIFGGIMVLLSAYGAFTRNRRFFLSGLCFYSLLPIIGEGMAYGNDKAAGHWVMIFLFLVQFLLTIPNNVIYGPDNVAATALVRKNGLALIVINLGAAVYVLQLTSVVQAQFGYYHIAFTLLLIYIMARSLTNKTVGWAK